MKRSLNPFSCLTLFFCLLLGQGIDGQENPRLVYVYTRGFTPIWKDAGSNANTNVGIWKPTSTEGFFALGDYIQSDYLYPSNNVMMVMDKNDGLVVPPDSFTEVWNDASSLAKQNVAIYKMNARAGYTCIGHAAVGAYNIQPDKNAYRCVKNDLLVTGSPTSVWNTKGSQAKVPNSLWNINPESTVLAAIATGMFMVGKGVGLAPPYTDLYVLNSNKVIESSMASKINTEDIALHLYQTSDVYQIWNDQGSGAKKNAMSIWRVKECCSLGDMAAPNYNQMVGFVAVEMKEKILAKPTGFKLAWSNSGAINTKLIKVYKVAIWNIVCPAGYTAIGQMATTSYDVPLLADNPTIRCVDMTIVTPGKWTELWNDAGTGSKMDGAVWLAESSSVASKGVSAFKAVDWYNTNPGSIAYVLKSANVSIRTGKLIDKVEIRDVVYDFNKKKSLGTEPKSLMSTLYVNNCAGKEGDPNFEVTKSLEYTKKVETTWKYELKVAVGVSVTFTAGLPVVGQSTVTASLNVTNTFGTERKNTEETKESIAAKLIVPPLKKTGAYVEGVIEKIEVPWTATAVTTYKDGTTSFETIGGVSRHMPISNDKAVILPDEPCQPGDFANSEPLANPSIPVKKQK